MRRERLRAGGEVTWLSRNDWGAGPIRAGGPVPAARFSGIVSHHTVMPMRTGETADEYMRRLQVARPDLGSEVPYSWVILPRNVSVDAVIAEGRGLGWSGAHTSGLNSTRYGIAWALNTEDQAVTSGMAA